MQKNWLSFLFLLFFSFPLFASSTNNPVVFQFSVLDHPALHTHNQWENKIQHINSADISFSVINGLRADDEPCTDDLYYKKIHLFNTSAKPLFFSLAGNDWIGCKNQNGDDIRIERLLRLREILFDYETPFGTDEIPLIRQSHSSRYTDFPENTFWQYGSVFFLTLNLPAANNHYLNAAGRNNEFEDRLLANQRWLQRSFILAKRHQLKGIVIFCDGNPFKKMAARDGFREIRSSLKKLTQKFSGKVLLIHNQVGSDMKPVIHWENNLGIIASDSTWLTISVDPQNPDLFTVNK